MSDVSAPVIVDVITPTNRSGEYLHEASASVFAQSLTSWQHTIVDNGSPDPAALAAAVESVVRTLPDPDAARSRVSIDRIETRGISFGRNRGVELGTAPYVAFLDDDDFWEPEYLEQMVAALDANPQATATYSGGFFIDESGSVFGGWDAEPATRVEMLRGERPFPHIPAFVVRRAAAERSGWFDTSFLQAEDMEFMCRLLIEGEFIAVQLPLVHYRRHRSSFTLRADSIRLTWAASERFLSDQIRKARERGEDELAGHLEENRRRARRMFAEHEASKVLNAHRKPRDFGEVWKSVRQSLTLEPVGFTASLFRQAGGRIRGKAASAFGR